MNDLNKIFRQAKDASRRMTEFDDRTLSAAIVTLADLVDDNIEMLLAANAEDLSLMDKTNPLYDRLMLTESRLRDIAVSLRNVAALESPVGEVVERRTLPNGIDLKKVRVPFGVVGVIYEARPNVTFEVFSLCLKSGNVSLLKGGHDAEHSNRAAMTLIADALSRHGLPGGSAILLPSTHDATKAMLEAVGYVDVCIPRGGRRLIDLVRDMAKVPVIETGAGIVHAYFDRDGDLDIGRKVVLNAKTRRVSVCNALDTLLIDRERLCDLASLCKELAAKSVELHADSEAYTALEGSYPSELLVHADDKDWSTEWMDYKMGVRTVGGIEDAIAHIALHGSGHSETIITENINAAKRFQRDVDAACVYVNLPTSFTDGGQFGLGAEIGISTQKLGPRGPMGLREITTTRYLLTGRGQTRL